jgi:FAD:protein FMN transferase
MRFPCFGASCTVIVDGDGDAVARARRRLLDWHARFTRFDATSELSRFNADPREVVPVSATLARLAGAVVTAGELSGGLVDGTLLADIEAAGYRGDLRAPLPLALALRLAPARRPAAPSGGWRAIVVDGEHVSRPPGVGLDGGGLAKGLFADLLAEDLGGRSFAVECAGDLRVGGAPRPVHVAGPFDGRTLHTFEIADAGVATSGIGRRSWLDSRGRPAHHLLDPSTGAPAFTGIVQATAVAPTALEAEVRAKAAVLGGPEAAAGWLPHGGVVVYDDGAFSVTGSLAPPTISV